MGNFKGTVCQRIYFNSQLKKFCTPWKGPEDVSGVGSGMWPLYVKLTNFAAQFHLRLKSGIFSNQSVHSGTQYHFSQQGGHRTWES